MRKPFILGSPKPGSAADGKFRQPGRYRRAVSAMGAQFLSQVAKGRCVHPCSKWAPKLEGCASRTRPKAREQRALSIGHARFVNQGEARCRALGGHKISLELMAGNELRTAE